jgi:hypothetical protein
LPRRTINCRRLALRRGVPHQPGIEGFGGEHGQDHHGTERERAAGLDRDHRAERDQGAAQRLHENVDHREWQPYLRSSWDLGVNHGEAHAHRAG